MSKDAKNPLDPPAKGDGKKGADAKKDNGKTTEAKKEVAPKRSKFAAIYPDNATFALQVEANPKKEGSACRERFEHWFTSNTIGEYREKGGTYADIAYDVGRAFVVVTKVDTKAA